MTEAEFRFKHSKLIEDYQLIEMRLKGLCSALLENNVIEWSKRIDDYEPDPFGSMLIKLKNLQDEKHKYLLSQEDFDNLNEMRQRRNYWVHQCFGGKNPIVFTRKGDVKYPEYAKQIIEDLGMAEEWNEKLTEIFRLNRSMIM